MTISRVCSNEADLGTRQEARLARKGAVTQPSANRQLRKGAERTSPIRGPREGEMMNQLYTGILQHQKDKQLQGPSKEAQSMDRTGDKLSLLPVQDTRSEIGLNIGSSAA